MLQRMEFEVFGRVQNVCFRQFTSDKAKQLNLVGWVMNDLRAKTVKGVVEGRSEPIEEMQHWLAKVVRGTEIFDVLKLIVQCALGRISSFKN